MKLILLMLLLAPAAIADPLHMTLLAVQEEDGNLTGNTANLYLELQPGKGRVFLETQPLTKIDTQISTRFAKEIACNYYDIDCSDTDFIFTISSSANIIGGPSAGASLAALSAAGLLDLPVNQKVAVTGTINSGGLIGPVGGVKAKIGAAAEGGMEKVLIPFGLANESELIEFGASNGLEVIKVNNLNEVVEHVTGRQVLIETDYDLTNPEYEQLMKETAMQLCSRSSELLKQMNINSTVKKDISEKLKKVQEAEEVKAYYSAASYCFGVNVQLRKILYQGTGQAKLLSKAKQIHEDITVLEKNVEEQNRGTITAIQAYSIVNERLNDARSALKNLTSDNVGYAEERFFSAKVWSKFFELNGNGYTKISLKKSCTEKLQEANERFQYLLLFLPVPEIGMDIKEAEEKAEKEEFELCLVEASQAKAQSNAILSTLGVSEEKLDELVKNKILALERLIGRTSEKHAFPILGYSYYEYSKSLMSEDMPSALLYAEYGLELSNLDIYFEQENKKIWRFPTKEAAIASAGMVVGIVILMLVFASKKIADSI